MSNNKLSLNLGIIKRILSYIRAYKRLFILAIIVTLSLSVMSIVRPLIINEALNGISTQQSSKYTLNTYCLILFASLCIEAILQFTNIYLSSLIGQNIIKDLREQVYAHIMRLKNSYFDNTPIGTLVTRAVSDIESLSDMFSQGFITISGDIVMLLLFISVMFYKNWLLALIVMSTIPILLIATNLFKKGIKKTFTEVRNAVAALNTFTQEHLVGMKIVQIFNREEEEYKKFVTINEQHKKANIRSIWYYSIFFPIVEILSAISIGLLIWFSGLNANKYHIQLGDITFFIMMINMLFRPIRMLADRLNTLQMGIVSSERVFKILDTTELIEDTGTLTANSIKGDIEFKRVWFAYKQDNYVIKDVSFKIRAGDTVAFVGTTGAGKSTIINLLSRFYDIQKGAILIDGIDHKQYQLDQLRQATGVVLQDVYLFNDTIYNNIALHNSLITKEQVIAAAKNIGLHDFISSLPDGYDYIIKERGITLSSGQRQLIAFIRAYVYNPTIFILDEATSAIDTETELLIQKATETITKGRTSIIIAHRLATIKHANNVLVFENGQVIEQGSQQQLLELNGKFKQLYLKGTN